MKVLIIEDSAQIAEAVSLCIQLRWPEAIITAAVEGNQGLGLLTRESFDMVILDINLPDIDGFEVLKQIRASSDVPTIILTVRGREDDQAKGLELGADDYIVKPFRPKDLVARVNAVFRRTYAPQAGDVQTHTVLSGLSLNPGNAETGLEDRIVKLTYAEARLLHFMVEKFECTLASEPISSIVWSGIFNNPDHLKTSIKRLKDKLSQSLSRTISPDHPEEKPPSINPD
ncbi:MAG: response regulator transcription factor [Dehalococcoidales bacterium]|nr:MAG: response regulator transcription factor [Dehalococcoidales bacterium]